MKIDNGPSSSGPRRRTSPLGRDEKVQLGLLLLVALLLRVGFVLLQPPDAFLRGGDGPWYVLQGWRIAHRALPHPLTTVGPLYPLGLAGLWLLFPGAPEPAGIEGIPPAFLLLIRLVQSGLSVAVVWLAYRITRDVTQRHTPAMVAGAGLALGPAFILEPMYLLTEPVYMILLTLGVWLYLRAARSLHRPAFLQAGFVFGLAALTRPVSLLLPALTIPHLWTDPRPQGPRRGLGILLAAFGLTVLPWSIYLGRTTGRVLPEGFAANLWIGSVGEGRWEGDPSLDRWVQEFGVGTPQYAEEVWRTIASDPLGWLAVRARNLASAVLTPHGTSDLGGPSIKRLMQDWLSDGMTADGLRAILEAPNFGLKLVIYCLHYLALALAAVGVLTSLPRWRDYYGIYAGAFHLLLVYFVLTALPRYLFPAEVFLWVLAAVGAHEGARRLCRNRRGAPRSAGRAAPSAV